MARDVIMLKDSSDELLARVEQPPGFQGFDVLSWRGMLFVQTGINEYTEARVAEATKTIEVIDRV